MKKFMLCESTIYCDGSLAVGTSCGVGRFALVVALVVNLRHWDAQPERTIRQTVNDDVIADCFQLVPVPVPLDLHEW